MNSTLGILVAILVLVLLIFLKCSTSSDARPLGMNVVRSKINRNF